MANNLEKIVRSLLPCSMAVMFLLASTSQSLAYWVEGKRAKFRGLDKITGRTVDFYVAKGEKVNFGSLELFVSACFKRPPDETPETSVFLQVNDLGITQVEKKRAQINNPIFSGWMFASSPALNGLEHNVYDFWVLDCDNQSITKPSTSKPE